MHSFKVVCMSGYSNKKWFEVEGISTGPCCASQKASAGNQSSCSWRVPRGKLDWLRSASCVFFLASFHPLSRNRESKKAAGGALYDLLVCCRPLSDLDCVTAIPPVRRVTTSFCLLLCPEKSGSNVVWRGGRELPS